MTRRIDVELTSQVDDGWTWRAAGAKLPKGVVEGNVVPEGARPGDVLRAEIESDIDGITIVALSSRQTTEAAPSAARIEVTGTPRREAGISVKYAPAARGGRGSHSGPGRSRDDDDRRSTPGRGRPRADKEERSGGGDDRAGRGNRDRRERPSRGRDAGREPHRRDADSGLPASTVHRNAMLGALGPEQIPIAEQLIRGGIPAVRKAIAEQQRLSPGTGMNADAILAIADGLLGMVNLAKWKDRAAAAQSHADKVRLPELRSIVAASRAVTLDDEGRQMAKALTETLKARSSELQSTWLKKIIEAIENDRILDAVKTASRPPEPGARLPAIEAVRLAEAIGHAMTASTDQDAWLRYLDAALESPVRRTVKPEGIPDAPVVREAAKNAAGHMPELAKLLGLRIPPPPPRRPLVRRVEVSRGADEGSKAEL